MMTARTAEGQSIFLPGCPPSIRRTDIQKVWTIYVTEVTKRGPMTSEDIRGAEKLFLEYQDVMDKLGALKDQKRDARFFGKYAILYARSSKLVEELSNRMAPTQRGSGTP